MAVSTLVLILALAPPLAMAQANPPAPTPSESTDVYIRRLAGLSASSADGPIKIIDVGHHPLDTMISIVASKGPTGWHVSYACAASPYCAQNEDHLALSYDLDDSASRQVDEVLNQLKVGDDPGGEKPSPVQICGRLKLVINYQGFQKNYFRSCSWGPTLGQLEVLLKPPGA